jgi:hypothetical protein
MLLQDRDLQYLPARAPNRSTIEPVSVSTSTSPENTQTPIPVQSQALSDTSPMIGNILNTRMQTLQQKPMADREKMAEALEDMAGILRNRNVLGEEVS